MVRWSLPILLLMTCVPHRIVGGPPPESDPLVELTGMWWFPARKTPNEHRILGCMTPCGVHALGTVKCDTLALSEKAAIAAYEKHVKLKTKDMCDALMGWRIYVATPGETSDAGIFWEKDPALQVYGVTDCSMHELYLAIDDWDNGALAHELGHVFDCMLLRRPELGHSGWTKTGHCAAINEASKLKEDCSLPKFK